MTGNALDTGTDHLLAELESGVLTLTMNRPEARNAFSGEMIGAFSTQLAQAEINPEVRCILVNGAGKGFCAGGDIKGMAKARASGRDGPSSSVDARIHRQRIDQRAVSGRLFTIPKPTLAALPGTLPRVRGMGIALSCDLRIMANSAILHYGIREGWLSQAITVPPTFLRRSWERPKHVNFSTFLTE